MIFVIISWVIMMDNCIFCKIINGDIPCMKIYEDEDLLSFLDINPFMPGHVLIIPKEHTLDLESIDMETLNHILIVAKKLKKVLEDKLNIDGLTLIQNSGDVQEVKHFHLHLKPFYNEKQEILDIEKVYEILTK